MKKISFIGMGNMAQAMVAGFTASGKVKGSDIYAYAPDQQKLAGNCGRLGINQCGTIEDATSSCDTLIMACKPYQIDDVLSKIGASLSGKAIVSVAAGWNFDRYKKALPEDARVQCIMPNTPVAVSRGVLLVEEENDWQEEERRQLFDILSSTGRVIELPDRLMTAAMAISGCGPAFMDMIIEALGDAAVKNGIQRKQAYELAAQTMAGSAQLMLDTGLHPGQLKDNVCSPGGTTIKGVASLEESGLRYAFIKAVDAIVKG